MILKLGILSSLFPLLFLYNCVKTTHVCGTHKKALLTPCNGVINFTFSFKLFPSPPSLSLPPSKVFFLIFIISNKDVYSRTLPHAKRHKAKEKIKRKKIKTKRKDTNYKGEN